MWIAKIWASLKLGKKYNMQLCKDIWDSFLDQNNFDLNPIYRNPMTGKWPAIDDEILDLTGGFENPSIVARQTELIEIPDEWVLPVTSKNLPPKENQRIQSYILSEQGLLANRGRMEKGFKYKKCTFEEYAECVVCNARHYMKTVQNRQKSKK